MKLFYTKAACSLVIRIVLHELSLSFESESVDLAAKKTETGADFLQINSKGAVPALLLDNGEVITENVVIQQYLADEYHASQLLPPLGDLQRYRILEILNYITTDIHKTFGFMFNAKLMQGSGIQDTLKQILQHKFHYLAQKLAQHAYVAGDNYTLPDAYLFVMLLWSKKFHLFDQLDTVFHEYFAKLLQRQAIKQALQEEGLSMG